MVIDSHCHAWAYWPYQSAVPDPESRGLAEQLLYEMDQHQVDRAMVVCAQIEHNPANNAYVAGQVQRHPARLIQIADLDSAWSPAYHTPGGALRLRQMAADWPIRGFTHYLDKNENGAWLNGEEGQAIFAAAAELGLLASLSCYPHQLPAVRAAAGRNPQVPVLLHHLGHPALGKGTPQENLREILLCARVPNIAVKLSGFAYAAERDWDFPYQDVQAVVKAEYDAFGPQRMHWGSDYPVVRLFMTYRQSLEAFRAHCTFIPAADQALILGDSLSRLLKISIEET